MPDLYRTFSHTGQSIQGGTPKKTIFSLKKKIYLYFKQKTLNPLNAELNPICYLLALLGAHHFLHVSRIRVNPLQNTLHWRQYTCPIFFPTV
jgi:hypothetical protein